MSKHSRAGEFCKVGENLYRYSSNGIYYGVFRDQGKLKWKSLKTTDKALAKRRLPSEIEKARRIDPKAAKMTLGRLLGVYEDNLRTLDTKTVATRKSIVKRFKATWNGSLERQVREITSNDLRAWLGLHRARLKKSSLNEYVRFLRHLFDAAVQAHVIPESPASGLSEFKREKPIRETPTWEEYEAIIREIRSQKLSDTAQDSADVVEFWALAGAGTAETANLLGDHIDWKNEELSLYRKKTDTGYRIPLFPTVRPLLERLHKRGQIRAGEPVFRVRDPKRALSAACKRLSYPKYSARAFRRLFVTHATERGIDFKTLSAWQGHRDGGVLIAKTYSHLRDAHSKEMAKLVTAPEVLPQKDFEI